MVLWTHFFPLKIIVVVIISIIIIIRESVVDCSLSPPFLLRHLICKTLVYFLWEQLSPVIYESRPITFCEFIWSGDGATGNYFFNPHPLHPLPYPLVDPFPSASLLSPLRRSKPRKFQMLQKTNWKWKKGRDFVDTRYSITKHSYRVSFQLCATVVQVQDIGWLKSAARAGQEG